MGYLSLASIVARGSEMVNKIKYCLSLLQLGPGSVQSDDVLVVGSDQYGGVDQYVQCVSDSCTEILRRARGLPGQEVYTANLSYSFFCLQLINNIIIFRFL